MYQQYKHGLGDISQIFIILTWEIIWLFNAQKVCLKYLLKISYIAYTSPDIHTNQPGFGTYRIQDIFSHIYQTYRKILPTKLNDSRIKLMTSIPAYLHTAVMSKQIEDCQRLATAGGVAITNAKNCQSNKSKIILYTGKFQLAYHTWISQIPTNKIYINIKAIFSE